MAVEIFDCAQGTPEWHRCRLGIPTASKFSDVLAEGEGKTRAKYMRQLAGEIITGEIADGFSNEHTARGHVMEPDARIAYAFMCDQDPVPVGFLRNGKVGASPDSLIGKSGLLEIKTKLPDLQIQVLERGSLPPEHRAQVQGQLHVSEREFVDFVSYWPRMPLFVTRVYRDEKYIKNLADKLEAFNAELAELVDRIKRFQIPKLTEQIKCAA